jgi:hypothetical protein
VALGMMLPTDRMAVLGVGVPFHPPATVNMAVVPSQKQVERACKRGDKRDVCERSADEVVAAVGGPVDQVMKRRCQRHLTSLTSPSGDVAEHSAVAAPRLPVQKARPPTTLRDQGWQADGSRGQIRAAY